MTLLAAVLAGIGTFLALVLVPAWAFDSLAGGYELVLYLIMAVGVAALVHRRRARRQVRPEAH